ncbi:hypothetical protein cand_029820 [Cryptosporidium andersoni]|uniref:Uncharacterized protein n=1 Tax=Cryptosporidium andersoni TaxID=117008 RepID=A0A1J4MNC2_9CRYT|nr:hypothetical protein cand_029820 [Cryptosporidium andersoni]
MTSDKKKGTCGVAFETILNGLGLLGNQFRTALIATKEVVKDSVYPLKENCIRRYYEVNPAWHDIGSKTSVPNQNAVLFADSGASETIDTQSSIRSTL